MGVMTLQLLGYNNVSGFPPSINGWTTAGVSNSLNISVQT